MSFSVYTSRNVQESRPAGTGFAPPVDVFETFGESRSIYMRTHGRVVLWFLGFLGWAVAFAMLWSVVPRGAGLRTLPVDLLTSIVTGLGLVLGLVLGGAVLSRS